MTVSSSFKSNDSSAALLLPAPCLISHRLNFYLSSLDRTHCFGVLVYLGLIVYLSNCLLAQIIVSGNLSFGIDVELSKVGHKVCGKQRSGRSIWRRFHDSDLMNYLCEQDILGSPIMSVSNEHMETQSGAKVGIAFLFLPSALLSVVIIIIIIFINCFAQNQNTVRTHWSWTQELYNILEYVL